MEREARNPGFPWLLAGLILLPFLPSLASLLLPLPPLSGHDLFFTFGPKMDFAHQVPLSAVRPPLWQPTIYGGHPFAGNPQAMAYYPSTGLFFLFGWSLPLASWVAAFHVLLSGIFFYFLARRLGAPEGGARLGALAWALGGQSMGRIFAGHLSWTCALPWIPLLFLGILDAVERHERKGAAEAGLAAGLLFLSGAPQAAAYALLGALFFTSWLLGEKLAAGKGETLLPSLGLLAPALLPAFLMGLAQALPTLPFFPLVSPGGRFPFSRAASGSMDPAFLATLLFPAHFGLESKVGGFSWEQSAYAGVPALLLALRGLFFRPRGKKVFFLLLFLFALVFALGPATPLFSFFYRLPLLGAFRTPGRMMVLAAFSLALLAALGFPARPGPGKGWKEVLPAVLLLPPALFLLLLPSLTGGVTGFSSTTLRVFGLLVLTASALFSWRHPSPGSPRGGRLLLFLEGTDLLVLCALPAVFPPGPPAAPGNFRAALAKALDSLPSGPVERNLYRVDHPDLGALGLYPELSRRSIDSTRGNYDPAVSRDYRSYLDALDYLEKRGGRTYQHALDLLAVRYRFTRVPPRDRTREEDRRIAPGVHFVKRMGMPGRFRWVEQARLLPDRNSWWLLHLGSPDPPDPARVVTFLSGRAPPVPPRPGPGRVRLLAADPGRIRLEVTNEGPGFVVLSENDIPGWKAFLDGKEVPLYKADLLFMALPVEKPGRHTLLVEYAPAGASLSFFLALLGILSALFLRREGRGKGGRRGAAPHQGR